jgi:cobalt-precorrin-5B (C1)-methyltransferase
VSAQTKQPTGNPQRGARPLRRGWTTGACATGAAKAAYWGLLTGEFPDPVAVSLPRGEQPCFALAMSRRDGASATAGIIKDAGDDPDVTHGALIMATVRDAAPGRGVVFCAGAGVGMVTRPGLPIPPGEPAINPVPRAMIRQAITEVAAATGKSGDVEVEIAIPGGEALAARTLNARLGIIGGLSILGTTGIVVPYSCSAWIHAIRSGIDVARALGLTHIAGATGATSEAGVKQLHELPEPALIDMGDFVGGMLKYVRTHPVARVSVAGGVAKITKLAQGLLDLHSARGALDLSFLATVALSVGGTPSLRARIARANTAAQAFADAAHAGCSLANAVARLAWQTAARVINDPGIELEIVVFDRDQNLVGRTPFAPTHGAAP